MLIEHIFLEIGMITMVHKGSSQYTKASALTMNSTQTVNQTSGSVDRANFRFCCIIVPPSDIKVFFFMQMFCGLPEPPYSWGPQQTSKGAEG